jgi:tetratricopeptide (TPR) repeat protein
MTPLSHHTELTQARLWRASNTRPALEQARELLVRMRARYPYVLAVAHELILVLEKLGDVDGAVRELEELERTFPSLDEETLARGGRLYKTLAARTAGDKAGLGRAVCLLETAERYYHRAFEVRKGFYPRVNELTVRFLRAGKLAALGNVPEAQKTLREARSEAREMLEDPTVWESRRDDDVVWLPATRGEIAFLCGDWSAAEAEYGKAKRAANGKVFYFRAMRDQLRLLAAACEKLNITPLGPLSDPDAFFALPEDPAA